MKSHRDRGTTLLHRGGFNALDRIEPQLDMSLYGGPHALLVVGWSYRCSVHLGVL
jgi:hypothetical protein